MPTTVILSETYEESVEAFHTFIRNLYKSNSQSLIERTVEVANMVILQTEKVIFSTYDMMHEFELDPNIMKIVDAKEVIF